MFDLDKQSILIYIIIAFVIFVCLKIYSESDAYNLKCIISDVDGERYCVRESAKMELAADLLATVTKNCKDLVAYCAKKFPDDENVQRLVQKFNPTKTIGFSTLRGRNSAMKHLRFFPFNLNTTSISL